MPSLRSLTILGCPKLKALPDYMLQSTTLEELRIGGNEDKTNIFISSIMPSLRSLEITYCPKLKALPDYVLPSTTLEQLTIENNPILGEQFEGVESWPNASHTPVITIT
jgi:hypothetical protein